jgi:hypothetical protein
MIQAIQMQIQMQTQAQAQAEALAEARAQTQALQAQLQSQLQSQQPTASSDTLEQTRIHRRILQMHETNKTTRQIYEKIKLKKTINWSR